MSLRITYHERADLYDAWSWYEARERGLGDRFIAAVDAALDQVAERPVPDSGSPAIGRREVTERRLGTTGFPGSPSCQAIRPLMITVGTQAGLTKRAVR